VIGTISSNYETVKRWRRRHRQRHQALTRRYYARTAFAPAHGAPWMPEEVEAIMSGEHTDRELSKILGRSMHAIQNKRSKIRKTGGERDEETT
jgi:hypothetical protein